MNNTSHQIAVLVLSAYKMRLTQHEPIAEATRAMLRVSPSVSECLRLSHADLE